MYRSTFSIPMSSEVCCWPVFPLCHTPGNRSSGDIAESPTDTEREARPPGPVLDRGTLVCLFSALAVKNWKTSRRRT